MSKNIYELDIHEEICLEEDKDEHNSTYVLRVAGGWIYKFHSQRQGCLVSTAFVPWNTSEQHN